jgi:hypothetical protein
MHLFIKATKQLNVCYLGELISIYLILPGNPGEPGDPGDPG